MPENIPKSEKVTEILNWGMGVNKTEEGEVISYGFAERSDPNLFQPDPKASTSEQRKVHKKCLKTWNGALGPNSWENYNTKKEEEEEGENVLSELDLTSPKTIALNFVDIVRTTGKARCVQFANGSQYWFPKSRTFINEEEDILYTEDWLLKDKPGTEDFIRRD